MIAIKYIPFLYLLLLLPYTICQSQSEILESINGLFLETRQFQFPENYKEFDHSPFIDAGEHGTYDFIIIGAGSAGTLLANRLSEVPEWNVLLLEAGGDESLAGDVPALAGLLQFSKYNWGYLSVPQKNACLGMKNKQCSIPRGKGLGGSSMNNFMIYTRGNKADFDKLSSDGNPGWSYEEILPYYIKMTKSSLEENFDPSYYGYDGALSVEHVRHFGELGQAYLDGQVELGRQILDLNGKDQMGFSRVQANTINGRRCSGNKAFLQPASGRENLKIVKGAFVTRILFDKENKRAIGVEFLVHDKKYHAKTTKEVILSAGSVGSPQILMHSGIGPREDLEALGIDVIENLSVGKNLHDHPVLSFPFVTNFSDPGFKSVEEMVSEYINGFGYLTTAGNIQSIGFINTEDESSTTPDIEQLLLVHFDLTETGMTDIFNYGDELIKAYFDPYGTSCAAYGQYLTQEKSRGSIKLKSKNIFDHPLIDLNFYDDSDDLERMVNGLKDFLKILDTKAMQKFNARYLDNPIPQCPQEFMSDDYLACLIRHVTFSLYHISGTCKMGPDSDPEAVVDHRLKVKGFNNLRVVDASIMPFPIAAHMNAPTYMIAEKASDMIIKEWRYTTPDASAKHTEL